MINPGISPDLFLLLILEPASKHCSFPVINYLPGLAVYCQSECRRHAIKPYLCQIQESINCHHESV